MISVSLYGYEVWSYENVDIAELFNVKMLKHIIFLKQHLNILL